MSGRIRKANRYVQRAMRQAAWAASHTKQTYLSAFYRRMAIRKGATKAIVALAHHMLVVIYQVLSRGEEYVEMGGDPYDRRNQPKTVARLLKRLQSLGYEVAIQPAVRLPQPESAPTALGSDLAWHSLEAAAVPNPPGFERKRRGRPCKCAERGIICRHGATGGSSSLPQEPFTAGEFS